MVQKARTARKPAKKIVLQKATASEIIASHGITDAELRRARALIALVTRRTSRASTSGRKRVSGGTQRLPKSGAKTTASQK